MPGLTTSLHFQRTKPKQMLKSMYWSAIDAKIALRIKGYQQG